MNCSTHFRTVWQPSLQVDLGENLVLHSVQPPASGAILAYVLNTLKYYYIRDGDLNPLLYHRVPISSIHFYNNCFKKAVPFSKWSYFFLCETDKLFRTFVIEIGI